jgi:hypothetical protein
MTAWSGLFDGFYGSPYVLQFPKNRSERSQVGLQFMKRGMAKDKALVTALLGTAAGGTAASTWSRVKDQNIGPTDIMKNGGIVALETVTDVNRATTAADVTELMAYMFNYNPSLTVKASSSGTGIPGSPSKF